MAWYRLCVVDQKSISTLHFGCVIVFRQNHHDSRVTSRYDKIAILVSTGKICYVRIIVQISTYIRHYFYAFRDSIEKYVCD